MKRSLWSLLVQRYCVRSLDLLDEDVALVNLIVNCAVDILIIDVAVVILVVECAVFGIHRLKVYYVSGMS